MDLPAWTLRMICCLNSLVKIRRLRLIVGGLSFGVYHLNFLSHFRGAVQGIVNPFVKTVNWPFLKKLALARTLRADPTLPIGDICKTLGVSKATFYRYTTPSISPQP